MATRDWRVTIVVTDRFQEGLEEPFTQYEVEKEIYRLFTYSDLDSEIEDVQRIEPILKEGQVK